MLKRFFFAVAPLMLIAGTVVADDSLLSAVAKFDSDNTNTVQTEEMDELGKADVDALLGEDEETGEEAIAACFRRYGRGYGYRGYGYRSYYGHSYNYCRPVRHCYSYPSYSYCYRPVQYSYYTPCYTSYWGCW